MSAKTGVRMLTPAGIGGIAVVELAGAAAEDLLSRSLRSRGGPLDSFALRYGHIVRDGEVLDEVLVARIPVADSREVFEIHCHGGMVPARRIMDSFVAAGAVEADASDTLLGRPLAALERRLAEQLIHARTRLAADVLLVQMSGRLRPELEAARRDRAAAAKLLATWNYGRRLVEPATVVITGAPNVGKSTLANALVGRERSIVHHLPGTTRDAVTSVASLEGLPVVVVDTAGLREATDEIERLGVAKAVAHASACDLVVWVFDHSRDVTAEEARYLAGLRGMTVVPVVNKMDLAGPLSAGRVRELAGADAQPTCALTGRGVDELRARLVLALVGQNAPARDAAVVTLADVADALEKTVRTVDTGARADYLGCLLM